MKLTNAQVANLLAGLRHVIGADDIREGLTAKDLDTLCETLNTRDVWVVPPNTIEQIKEHFTKLDELHAKLKDTTNQYIAQVQMKCRHQMQFSQVDKRWYCKLCGMGES